MNELYDIIGRLCVIEKDCVVIGASKGYNHWDLEIQPLTDRANLYDVCFWLHGSSGTPGWKVIKLDATKEKTEFWSVSVTREDAE